MKILVGLGNPGPKYETTRHNIGFLAIDRLIDAWDAKAKGTSHQAELFEVKNFGKEKINILLAKPQTFMNRSGTAVQGLMHFYKCEPEDLIVLYDDVDIARFQMKIKKGGGSAGHNGIKSIDQNLGAAATDYIKMRLGVGRPPRLESGEKQLPTDAYVLQNFSDSELELLDPFLATVTDASKTLIEGTLLEAMNRFNTKSESPSKGEK